MRNLSLLGGFTSEAFKKWKEFLALGIPGLFMLCLEFWAFEVIALMAGWMGTTELAAQSVCFSTKMLYTLFLISIFMLFSLAPFN